MGKLVDTLVGSFVRKVTSHNVLQIEKKAYNDSVLAAMADLNTESQLQEKGVFADGSDTPEYSPITVELKKLKNQRYDHMTFKDTGETLSSVRYIYNSGKLYVNWNDIHNLQSIYGNEKKRIIGLTGESINEIKDEIIENIQEKILEKK
jgi:hypothetical protein